MFILYNTYIYRYLYFLYLHSYRCHVFVIYSFSVANINNIRNRLARVTGSSLYVGEPGDAVSWARCRDGAIGLRIVSLGGAVVSTVHLSRFVAEALGL